MIKNIKQKVFLIHLNNLNSKNYLIFLSYFFIFIIFSFFLFFYREILSKAENSRTGHQITNKQIQIIEQNELKHEEELEKVRLRHISLRSLHKKLEKTLRAREQLAEGLHMIDFEQLKIENQTLNEKIEERNEELSKLKRKKTTTVQVLTHIREKLRFIEQQNKSLQNNLSSYENNILTIRNQVTNKKLTRDELRIENKELKNQQGLANSNLLLIDYETRKHKSEELHAAITELKNRYDILIRQVNTGLSFTSGGSQQFGNYATNNNNNNQPLLTNNNNNNNKSNNWNHK